MPICLCTACVCPSCMHIQYVCRTSLILNWDLKRKIHEKSSSLKKRTKCDRLVLVAVSLVHSVPPLQCVWSVKYSVKVPFNRRSQATHFSCFDRDPRIIYIWSLPRFTTETTVTTGSFYSIQSLNEQCAFCTAPIVPLSFYENKHGALDCRHLLCASVALFSLFPRPGKPAKWVGLQSGSVSGRFSCWGGKSRVPFPAQPVPSGGLRETIVLWDFHMLCHPLLLSDHLELSPPAPTPLAP